MDETEKKAPYLYKTYILVDNLQINHEISNGGDEIKDRVMSLDTILERVTWEELSEECIFELRCGR